MDEELKKIIKTLENILDANYLEKAITMEIERSVKKIRELYADDILRVAVLGEFSAGKSSFINALLREEVLTSGDAPTTAVNTYLSYADNNTISVVYHDDTKKIVPFRRLHKYVTTNSELKEIKRINIKYNNKVLKEGIEIIDTPGSNVDNKRHNLQRLKAVEDASVGIFLMSIQNPASKSFINFLNENKSTIHRIIFVVAKCDLLAEDMDIDGYFTNNESKLMSIYNYINEAIKTHTNIKKPSIHMVSSKFFSENKKLDYMDVSNNFLKVEEDIRIFAIKDKERIIYNEVLITLKSVLKETKEILRDKAKLYQTNLENIKSEMQSLETLLQTVEIRWDNELKNEAINIKNEAREIISGEKEKTLENLVLAVYEIQAFGKFKKEANSIAKKHMELFMSNCSKRISMNVEKYGNRQVNDVQSSVKDYFDSIEQAYEHLGITRSLQVKKNIRFVEYSIIAIAFLELIGFMLSFGYELWIWRFLTVAFLIVIHKYFVLPKKTKFTIPIDQYFISKEKPQQEIEFHGKNSNDGAVGLTGGAVIGAIFGGPIGAAIGAGIGGFLGMVSSESRLEKAKITFLYAIQDTCNEIEESTYVEAVRSIVKKDYELRKGFNNYISDYKTLNDDLLNGIENHNQSLYLKYGKAHKTIKLHTTSIDSHLNYIGDKLISTDYY